MQYVEMLQIHVLSVASALLIFIHCILPSHQSNFVWVVKEAPYTRLCNTKPILTVNGRFPGPTLHVHKGDTITVKLINRSPDNITIHWHGVQQPRNPWSDGPEYITQCPIQPGSQFTQTVIFSEEEGTLWWHAHSDWARATVHGAIIIYPRSGTTYPFPKPDLEVPIILGEWWIRDVMEVLRELTTSGGTPNDSEAFTINGQPGDFYPCSSADTFRLRVSFGATVLLRIINADMNEILYVTVANHSLTVVGTDGSYTKPLISHYLSIGPGQTMDVLLTANQSPGRYYLTAGANESGGPSADFDNSTTTAIVEYDTETNTSSTPVLPNLLFYNDTNATYLFTSSLRSLASAEHPVDVPKRIDQQIITTISFNALPCPVNGTCAGPNGSRIAASMNNISFVLPRIDILEAYHYHIRGVFGKHFPQFPPLNFNFTAEFQDLRLEIPNIDTQVRVLKYNTTVEMTFQGTSLLAALDHPMHLHGQSFYVVGYGFGNFDNHTDPENYNLVDPPFQNTVIVPRNGWTTIRFRAHNPGVWYMHCHLEPHVTWGMMTTFIVEDGDDPNSKVLPPPPDMPPC